MRRAIAVVAGLLAVGCSDTSGAGNMGLLTVQLTDAPFPFDQIERADIYVVSVEAKMAATTSEEAADDPLAEDNTDPSTDWVSIATPNQAYDLLDLQNGTTVNLGQATLPTGTYRGFRLILNTDLSSVTLKDGTVLNGNSVPGIKWPSAGQTGIKVNLIDPIDVTADGTLMVLDFDLGNSFVLRGNTITENGLLFKPVIRASAEDETGAVSGVVRADNADGDLVPEASVDVLVAGTTIDDTDPVNVVATGVTDDQGAFTIKFLPPGTYTIRAQPPAALTEHTAGLINDVTVTTGETTGDLVIVLPHQ